MSISYWNVLLHGTQSFKSDWSSSDFTLSEKTDAQFNKTTPNLYFYQPEIEEKDGSYLIDGCLYLKFANSAYLTSLEKIRNQMFQSTVVSALGSLAVLGLRQWTKLPTLYSAFLLISQILLPLGAILSARRSAQIDGYLSNMSLLLKNYPKDILILRREFGIYIFNIIDIFKFDKFQQKFLHSTECKKLNENMFHTWSSELLKMHPNKAENCLEWLNKFFETNPFDFTNAIFERGVGTTDRSFFDSLANEYNTLKKEFEELKEGFCESYTHSNSRTNKTFLPLDEMTLRKKYPQIQNAFEHYTQNQPQEQKERFAGYVKLVHQATNTTLEKQQDRELMITYAQNYYLKVRHFLEKLIATPTQLDEDFYKRARALKPSVGTQEEYLNFLEKIHELELL